jgi:GAF domain-containing protein/HAMP domain-containing protein
MNQPNRTTEQKAPIASAIRSEGWLFGWTALFFAFFSGILALIFLYQAFLLTATAQTSWQLLSLGGIFGFTAVISSVVSTIRASLAARMLTLLLSIQIGLMILSALVKSVGATAALIALLTALILNFISSTLRRRDLALFIGITGAISTALASIYSPFLQIQIPAVGNVLLAMIVLQVALYMFFMSSGLGSVNLRSKLLTAALAIAIIPLVAFSLIQTRNNQTILRNQNHENIRLAAFQTAGKVDDYLIDSISSANVDAKNPLFAVFLQSDEAQRTDPTLLDEIHSAFTTITSKAPYGSLDSVAIINTDGINIIDSKSGGAGSWEGNRDYVSQPLKTGWSYTSSVIFDRSGLAYIAFSSPIRDNNLKILGLLRIRHRAEVFQLIISANQGLLGEQSYPILVDENYIRLADAADEQYVFHPLMPLSEARKSDLVITNRLPGLLKGDDQGFLPEAASAIENDAENPNFTRSTVSDNEIPYAGSVVKLRTVPWYVIYQQRQENLYTLFNESYRLTILVSTILVAFVSLASMLMAYLFVRPIVRLTTAAETIAAGNYSSETNVKSKDELGMLGAAFNTMARQVYTLIHELEERVQERTAEITHQNENLVLRSQQLQTVSDVARSIASTMELEVLLTQVAGLISERFNFYHVGIFLLDASGEYAVLRASNSEGGERMLARGHKLKVGATGIVGYACGAREARIATDVGKDSVFFNNPDLPLTRSEMAIPLKSGGNVIGALDVQSIHPNAFTQEDIELFSVLADQVAIAIVNNRLYAEANQSLAEIQELHRRYLRMEWKREVSDRTHRSYRYSPQGISPTEEGLQPEVEMVFETGKPLIQKNEDINQVVIPIILRGEPIGAIQLQEPGQENRIWTPEEIETAQALSDQIALALENARLLEQTTRRAERERKVLDITSKIRSTIDFQTIVQVAVTELQQALGASRAQVILQSNFNNDALDGNGHHPQERD